VKTQIIQLDPHDDVISASDRMGWGQTGRILLVWPEGGHVLVRRLDLVLLQRRSNAQGAQLALVTHDPEVRAYARELAIPVFGTLRRAQRAHWRVPRRYRRTRSGLSLYDPAKTKEEQAPARLPERPPSEAKWLPPTVRLGIFTLGVLAILAIAAVLLPAARLTLQPQSKLQEITLPIQANPQLNTYLLSGYVPARPRSVVVEGLAYQDASGTMQIPSQTATGNVQFTNLTNQPVDVPTGTIVTTAGQNTIRFEVVHTGTVPAGAGNSIYLPVKAQQPGSNGNQPANRLIALESELGTLLTVTNQLPISGGRQETVRAPSTSDRQQLHSRLLADLQRSALDELQKGLAFGDLLLPTSLQVNRVLEETYDPAETQPADRLSLSLRVEFQAEVVSGEDLQRLAVATLDASLPAGFSPAPETLKIDSLSTPQVGPDGFFQWQLHARRQLFAALPQNQAIQLAMGLSPTQAALRLAKELPLAGSPQIALTPAWWPRLPILPFRIDVQIAQQ
jgi:Baseplate J-like protein